MLGNIHENLINLLEEKIKVVEELYKLGFDLFFFLVSETDHLQHSRMGEVEEAIAKNTETPEFDLYREVDKVIGHFVELTEGSNLLLMSDHGFKTYNHLFYVNEWLVKNRYAKRSWKRNIKIKQGADNPLVKLVNALWMARPASLLAYKMLSPLMPLANNVKFRIESQVGYDLDMNDTMALCPSSEVRAVYFNDDRFPKDAKNSPSPPNIDEIMKKMDLIENINPMKREKEYWGPYAEEGPEILIDSDKYLMSRSLVGKMFGKGAFANHDKNGIFIIKSPLEKRFDETMHIWDVAPTILNIMGYEKTDYMDGKSVVKSDGELKKINAARIKLNNKIKNLKF